MSPRYAYGYKAMNLQTNELSDWVQSYTWEYFLTVTSRIPRYDAIAFMRDVENILTSRECDWWSNPDGLHLPTRMFMACEPHKTSRNLHVHGLIHGLPHAIYPPTVLQKPLDRIFGISRVEKVLNTHRVSSYCAKYVTKLGDGDNWNLFGNWG